MSKKEAEIYPPNEDKQNSYLHGTKKDYRQSHRPTFQEDFTEKALSRSEYLMYIYEIYKSNGTWGVKFNAGSKKSACHQESL